MAHDPPASGRAGVRVAFVTDIVTPYMVAVLAALARRCELSVAFCSRTGTRGMPWQIEVPFAHTVIGGLTIRRRSPDATDFYLSPRTLRVLLAARPQAIISGGFSFPSMYAAVCAHMRGVPLLIHSDGTARSEAGLGRAHDLARALMRRMAWGAVANSRPAAARFAQLGFAPERIFLAPHAAELSRLRGIGAARTYEGQRLRLLCVGRLIPRKGVAQLLRACARATAAGADVRLTVAGQGPEEPALRELAASLGLDVRWLGFVEQSRLPEVYERADAFAFPTLEDPYGLVLLEAGAAGLPLIASPHGGATEDLVRDGHSGLVVEPADEEALAAAIARLARDPALRARLGRAAYAATADRSPDSSAAGYLAAVSAALAGDGTASRSQRAGEDHLQPTG
ncbi:MAG TPA: glycosyltransferase family 4 protein [Solirubrobacteraceae bacterium]|nr:glycosyltransferase family 4 protein [Solirubrobacteraceae bacterium]